LFESHRKYALTPLRQTVIDEAPSDLRWARECHFP